MVRIWFSIINTVVTNTFVSKFAKQLAGTIWHEILVLNIYEKIILAVIV